VVEKHPRLCSGVGICNQKIEHLILDGIKPSLVQFSSQIEEIIISNLPLKFTETDHTIRYKPVPTKLLRMDYNYMGALS
jgi:hypothetical protein